MDTSKHTITIPISDYNELIAKSLDEKNENIIKHLRLLGRKGILGEMNFEKPPAEIFITQTMDMSVPIKIHFKY